MLKKLATIPLFDSLHSLLGRFVVASLVLLPIFIFLSGTLLINTFSHSQYQAEQEKLQAHLYLLLSLTEVHSQKFYLPEDITEPRFNRQNSGLYGFVFNKKNKALWRSNSATLLPKEVIDQNHLGNFNLGEALFKQISIQKLKLNVFSFDIEWVNLDDSITPLRYVIMSDNAALAIELNSYQTRLWRWLGAMSIALILAQMLIMYWGLRPLRQLSLQLAHLQENKIQQLDNDYPKEIKPITENFNAILNHEKKQRERYRNTMSDLAHSLKTPLAVIQSQLNNNSKPAIREQLDRINQIISHQLKRAVIRVNQSAITTSTDKISIHSMTKRLCKILAKVYLDHEIQFDNLAANDYFFYGDEADLLEVMGNILDNACKYGAGKVRINTSADNSGLMIYISDNGPGIPEQNHTTLLARGARGDTAQAGQGIGLSVAVDIVSSYGGAMTVNNNMGEPNLSGACFCIHFPTMSRA